MAGRVGQPRSRIHSLHGEAYQTTAQSLRAGTISSKLLEIRVLGCLRWWDLSRSNLPTRSSNDISLPDAPLLHVRGLLVLVHTGLIHTRWTCPTH
eukprot:358553-Chlamydomonas_euryale.AAC.7